MSHYRANGFSSELFASCLTQCLELRKIPYDLIVTTPSTLTKPENIIFRTEPEWMVRVKGKFIFNATIFSNPYDFKEEFLNTPAYIISLGKNPTATPITLPASNPDENITTNTITASMDTASRNMVIVHQKEVVDPRKKFYNATNIPIGINFLKGRAGKNFIELGAGITPVFASDSVKFENLATTFGHILIGYRYQPPRNSISFRIFFSPVFGSFGFIPYYGGASLGCSIRKRKK